MERTTEGTLHFGESYATFKNLKTRLEHNEKEIDF